MSGILIRARALAAIENHVTGRARADMLAVVNAVIPAFPAFVYGVASDADLPLDERCRRGVSILLQYAAVQLADDLADGDCKYLDEPLRTGPGVHWMLHHLYCLALQGTSISSSVIRAASADFLAVGEAQQDEVRTHEWTLEKSLRAAHGLNGAQYRAYFRLLWSGTVLESSAATLGEHYGIGLHVVGDSVHGDGRWAQLSSDARRQLAQHGLEALKVAERCATPYVRGQVAHLSQLLGRHSASGV
jgi:hypothetical protein